MKTHQLFFRRIEFKSQTCHSLAMRLYGSHLAPPKALFMSHSVAISHRIVIGTEYKNTGKLPNIGNIPRKHMSCCYHATNIFKHIHLEYKKFQKLRDSGFAQGLS